MRRLLLLLPLVALAGCTSTAGGASTTTTTTATTTATTTVTATPSASASDADLAERLIALACDQYVYALTLDAASGSAPLDQAASTATSGAVVDPSWTDVAGALALLAALPLTDVPQEDQTRATDARKVVESRCADAGAPVAG